MDADTGAGRARQGKIYQAGASGRRPTVPTDADGLAKAARRKMSRKAWAYVAGSAGEGRTSDNNREAFDRHRIIPRMAHGVKQRDLSVSIFGDDIPSPVLLAPVGAGALVHPDSDLLIGRAAGHSSVPYVISNQGSSPLEAITSAIRESSQNAGHWFQLYWSKDESLVDSLIARAEASGAGALVVTLDTTVLGWRPQDLNLGSLPFSRGQGIAQYTSDSHLQGDRALPDRRCHPAGQRSRCGRYISMQPLQLRRRRRSRSPRPLWHRCCRSCDTIPGGPCAICCRRSPGRPSRPSWTSTPIRGWTGRCWPP